MAKITKKHIMKNKLEKMPVKNTQRIARKSFQELLSSRLQDFTLFKEEKKFQLIDNGSYLNRF